MISNTESLRDKLVIGLFVSGVRPYNMRRLKRSSIIGNHIIIEDKPGKIKRKYHISRNILNDLNEFIKKQQIGKNEYLFSIPDYVVNNIVKKAGHSIGQKINVHSLRKISIATFQNYISKEHLNKMISGYSSFDKKYYEKDNNYSLLKPGTQK